MSVSVKDPSRFKEPKIQVAEESDFRRTLGDLSLIHISEQDRKGTSSFLQKGNYAVDSDRDLVDGIAIYDANRFQRHIPKVELVLSLIHI